MCLLYTVHYTLCVYKNVIEMIFRFVSFAQVRCGASYDEISIRVKDIVNYCKEFEALKGAVTKGMGPDSKGKSIKNTFSRSFSKRLMQVCHPHKHLSSYGL